MRKTSEDLFDLLTLSDKRKNVILMLRTGPKTLREIKTGLKTTSPAVIPQIRKLEKKHMLYQQGNTYTLTEKGKIATESFCRLIRLLKVLEEHGDFWKEHAINGMPEEFRLRLYELENSRIVRGSSTSIFEPHREFMVNLLRSRKVLGVSPIFHPEYPSAFLELIKNGADISLIVTMEIFERLKKEYRKELGKFIKHGTFMVCSEDVKIAFTVTEVFLSMGLFLKSGSYDTHQDLVSFEKSAIKWGEDMFNYYRERSEKVEPRSF